jgi:metal-responsive CopG/Arc/MetJ family transcriptional regulator
MKKISISIPDEMLRQVDEVGKSGLFNGVGRSELIRRAIEDWLLRQWKRQQELKQNG